MRRLSECRVLQRWDKLGQGGFAHLVRDQTPLNPQHHPLDCEHVGSLFVERVGYHERQHVSLVRNQQAKAALQFGQVRALCARCSISLERCVDRGHKGVGSIGFVENSSAP